MTSEASKISEWWRALAETASDGQASIDDRYQHLENAGLVSKVTVHRFICKKCGPLGTVIRVDGQTLLRTRDYKLSPGTNDKLSVESARRLNTLDGRRHWPAYTIDVDQLARSGPTASIDLVCSNHVKHVTADQILELTRTVTPGKPKAPTVF